MSGFSGVETTVEDDKSAGEIKTTIVRNICATRFLRVANALVNCGELTVSR